MSLGWPPSSSGCSVTWPRSSPAKMATVPLSGNFSWGIFQGSSQIILLITRSLSNAKRILSEQSPTPSSTLSSFWSKSTPCKWPRRCSRAAPTSPETSSSGSTCTPGDSNKLSAAIQGRVSSATWLRSAVTQTSRLSCPPVCYRGWS